MSQSGIVLLRYRPASVAAARWYLTDGLRAAGIHAEAIGDAALVVSELMSNSLVHASALPGQWVAVAWAVADGSVEVAVSDGGGRTWPRPITPARSAVGGRGLAIVDHLASRWGVRSSDSVTTVWAVLPAPGGGEGQAGDGQHGCGAARPGMLAPTGV